MSRDECAAASPRWGNGGGSCTCSGYARPGEPAVFDSSRCPVHAKPLPEARSAAQLSDERLDDLLHDAELLVEGASHGLRIPAIQWEDDVLVALRELKKKREALRAIDTYDKRLLIDQGRSLQAHIEEALRDAD